MTDPVFFRPSPGYTAGRIAELVGAELLDPDSHAGVKIESAAALNAAIAGSVVYIDHKRHASHLAGLKAAAVICPPEFAAQIAPGVAVLVSGAPQMAFAAALNLLYPDAVVPQAISTQTGISEHAVVAADAVIEAGVVIEAGAVIGARASIGSGSVIGPHAVIGPASQIGRSCHVGAGVTIQNALIGNRVIIHPGVRIGQDGFGYLGTREGPKKLLQIGRVVLQDDVEIGANSTVDRGALGDTVVGEGTKIDNLVQIAHNVRIGRGCVIAAMCGISGSVTIGDFVRIGGYAGLSDHVSVGDGAQIAAGSGVMHDIPPGQSWGGRPAQPLRAWLREVARLRSDKKADEPSNTGKA